MYFRTTERSLRVFTLRAQQSVSKLKRQGKLLVPAELQRLATQLSRRVHDQRGMSRKQGM